MRFSRKSNGEKREKLTKTGLNKAKRLFRFLLPYKWTFSLGLVFLLLSSLTTLAFPMLLGQLMDTDAQMDINRLGLILLAIFLFNAILSFFRILLFEKVAQKTLANIRQHVYAHLIRLPMHFFATRRVGELNSRISSDIALLQSTFTTTSAEFLRQILTILGGIALLVTISIKLTLFMLAIVPVIMIIVVFFGRFIGKLSKETQEKVAASNVIVEETLQGINNVKAFANERFEIARYTVATNSIVQLAIKTAKYRGAFVSFIIFGLFGSIIGVIWYGMLLKEQGLISQGDLFSFVLYTVFVGASIGGIADLYTQLVKSVGASEHLMDILDEKEEQLAEAVSSTSGPTTITGKINFEGVKFAYPSRDDVTVLKDISFEVEEGQQIAIVGSSGAGKSTIVSLLMRFYDPISGSIKVDDMPIKDMNLTDFRNQLALVPQEVLLFGGTIKENIGYGDPNASDEAIRSAAEKANALSFITSFPDGFDTIVGERGVQLSGGQRQRIAIARAVLKDPRILILDEATSSLDSESEQLVQDALDKLMKGRTSIVVAHRLSTIRKADQIIVLDQGQIVEVGTHEQLVAEENGIYAHLSSIQFSA